MTLQDFFAKVDTQLAKKLPFVIYRKPKETSVNGIFQNTDDLNFLKNFKETGFIFAPFFSDRPSVLMRLDEVFEILDFRSANFKTDIDRPFKVGQGQKKFHTTLVKRGIAEINKGSFKKIVLSRCLEEKCDTSPLVLFQKLLSTYDNAFCYLWYHPKVGMWLGATPEILLTLEDRQLTTISLAGTQPYDGEDQPVWGKKELEEQELVTQYIVDALRGKIGNLSRSRVQSIRAGNLMHLRTKITGRMEKDNLGAILRALHPTPAVCGLPKDITRDFILQHENYDRGFYTGYLGELNFKSIKSNMRTTTQEGQKSNHDFNSTLYVNLRCMQLKNGIASVYVGGGITKDSDPEQEWHETVAKSKTMLRIL